MRALQGLLREHRADQEARERKELEKKVQREQVSRTNRDQKVADPSQVLARRREFMNASAPIGAAVNEIKASPVVAAGDNRPTGRHRPVLTLKRA